MSNGFYQIGMQNFAQGGVVWKASGGSAIRSALVDSAFYTPSTGLATETTMSALSSGIEERSATMTLIDGALDGVVDAADVTFTATSGAQCEMIVVYKFVTVDGDSIPLFMWDTASGLPVTLGGDVTVAWDNSSNKVARI